jgi:hypothetical protein
MEHVTIIKICWLMLFKEILFTLRIIQHLELQNADVKFQVLTAVSMKLRIFWDVLLCS